MLSVNFFPIQRNASHRIGKTTPDFSKFVGFLFINIQRIPCDSGDSGESSSMPYFPDGFARRSFP